jgi:hypothetical protein
MSLLLVTQLLSFSGHACTTNTYPPEAASQSSHCSMPVKEKKSSCCTSPAESSSDSQNKTANSTCSISCDCEIKFIKTENTLVLTTETQLDIPDFPIQFEIELADSSFSVDVTSKHPPNKFYSTPIYKKNAVFLI